ncbi:MAG: Fibronectin/fibrinogen-binding protein [Labilithrix sp.]|nr:Fibronectin/fibrinogen-binding protein [Labilithrix sp.]
MAEEHGPSAIVQDAACAERVIVLEARMPGRTTFVLVAATSRPAGDPGRSGVGLLAKGALKELWGGKLPAGAMRQRGREESLVKARLLAVHEGALLFEPWSSRDENPERAPELAARAEDGRWPALVRALRVQNGRVVTTDLPPPKGLAPFLETFDRERDGLEQRGVAMAEALAADAIDVRRAELARALEKAQQRITRRRAAIGEDLAKIAQAERIAAQAQWLIGEAKRTPRGATRLVVTDWSSGEAVPLEVPLDPAKSASDQVEAMFKRAKRLKLGGRIASERLAQADDQWLAVGEALEALRSAASLALVEEAGREAKRRAPRDVVLPGAAAAGGGARTKDPSGTGRRVAYRTFLSRAGTKVLVGKGAGDNDTLTQRVARPHDLWLHAKDRTGAHVILPLQKGASPGAEDLVDAAHLAAHFSDARDEKAIDVQYTPKRYLRKPKGSAPGAVVVDREKVLVLRVEPALLRQLLEREEL